MPGILLCHRERIYILRLSGLLYSRSGASVDQLYDQCAMCIRPYERCAQRNVCRRHVSTRWDIVGKTSYTVCEVICRE